MAVTFAPNLTAPNAFRGSTPSGVNPADLATETASSNIEASPYNLQLADIINRVNREAQKSANLARIPGAAALEKASSENIAAELGGRLSQSYLDQLYTGLAESWGGRGFGVDTNALNASALRSIGLTTEELQRRGQEDLTKAYERNKAAPLFDIGQTLVTPGVYSTTAATQAALAEKAREFDAMMAQRAALSGGGGGGGYRQSGPISTYSGQPLTLYGGPGTVTTERPTVPESWDQFMTGGGEVTPLDWGYQPTSSGTMYMGGLEGYDPGLDAWLSQFEG